MGGDRPGRRAARAGVAALAGGDVDGRLAVHPRMHRRRLAVRRDVRRRRVTWALATAGLAAVLVGAYMTTRTALLDVDRIVVAGTERTSTGEVLAALGVEAGDPLLDVDPGSAARRIERLPWVDRADVRRDWPGTLRVEVTERRPVAVIEGAGRPPALVDGDGRVLAILASDGGDVADLTDGPVVSLEGVTVPGAVGEPVPARAGDALTLAEALVRRVPGVVSAVHVDLDAELASGGTVRFGSVEDLDEKLVALETVLADVDTTCLDVLDLRAPPRAAVTRDQGCP
ncbi:MAG: cell division protein FtsQ/DivIB [Acidimicrobiia bacterium]